MKTIFERFIKEARCIQPHRQCQKSDNKMVPLVQLPINSTRMDVFRAVSTNVEKLTVEKSPGNCLFYRMWHTEYSYVLIPPYSRFSKCQTCWEYRTCLESSSTNPTQKHLIQEKILLHQGSQIEEGRDYWNAKDNTKLFPNESLLFIVDEMDQNTTMVLKVRETAKGIEGRYMKTHLCGVSIHGKGLFLDVWIDSHHKYDRNHVITSIVYAIADVKARRGGIFPPTLRNQADNCGRENKNLYMFGMCVALVGLGYFAGMYLGFLLVRHTNEHIDQRFSVISETLKRQDIDSIQQLLDLVKEGTFPT